LPTERPGPALASPTVGEHFNQVRYIECHNASLQRTPLFSQHRSPSVLNWVTSSTSVPLSARNRKRRPFCLLPFGIKGVPLNHHNAPDKEGVFSPLFFSRERSFVTFFHLAGGEGAALKAARFFLEDRPLFQQVCFPEQSPLPQALRFSLFLEETPLGSGHIPFTARISPVEDFVFFFFPLVPLVIL